MACFHPTTAWKSRDANSGTGKRPLVFNQDKAAPCSKTQVPCGWCRGCRIDKTREWAVRIIGETRFHSANCFVTETYDDLHLPERNQLCLPDVQNYLKRLRHYHTKQNIEFAKTLNLSPEQQEQYVKDNPLRFYGVGEYGEGTQRPHYHHIFFGIDFFDDRKKHSKIGGNQYWKSDKLDELWGNGHCLISNVTPQSAAYVAGYVFKKINGELADEHYARFDASTGEYYLQNKEFSHMSRRPGIGQKHFETYKDEITLSDSVILNAREVGVPRYYDRLLEKTEPDKLLQLKADRQKNARKYRQDQTPERLQVREEVAIAKMNMKKRGLK